jgi:hypothetical protein
MGSALDLYESRVSRLERAGDGVAVHFSHAYIHRTRGTPGRDPGTGWSQPAIIWLHRATAAGDLGALPANLQGGYLESGGARFELIPLPFQRRGPATLHLNLDGVRAVTVVGERPSVALTGEPIFLEDQD